MPSVTERFIQTYTRLQVGSLRLLQDLYSDDVLFEDPFRRVTGLPALMEYFAGLYRDAEAVSFRFDEQIVQGPSAMLIWTMSVRHPRLNGGRVVTVPGSTHIKYREKVHYHRDYFDAGALLYEQIPLVGFMIRAIKARV